MDGRVFWCAEDQAAAAVLNNDDKAGCIAQQKHHCTSNWLLDPNRRHARHAAADVPVRRARRNPGRRAHTAPA
ncbi:hypothetical protein Xcc3_05480 [Xanthomonas campestris pv. campestris]|nr:hypothetical protein Xcc3_05480 [Xanthomonas campestris pv. campestris]